MPLMEGIESTPKTKDIGEEFGSLSDSEFKDLLRDLGNEPVLVLNADLSHVSDQNEFKIKARQVKAFLETPMINQQRSASIKATRMQMTWEPNVFSSGVEFIEA
jgi:hypothetical protein